MTIEEANKLLDLLNKNKLEQLREYIEILDKKYPLVELDILFNELNNKHDEYNRVVRKKYFERRNK